MKYALMSVFALFILGYTSSAQAQPLPKDVLEAVCTVGYYTLRDNNIDLETLKSVPEGVRNMGLEAIKGYMNSAGRKMRMMPKTEGPEPLPPELRESVCTVGVGALEDNGINLETLKTVPLKERNMGLPAIKKYLQVYPAQKGYQAKPLEKGQGGYPAQLGEQAGYPAEVGTQGGYSAEMGTPAQ